MNRQSPNKKVFVGLSGGVDSAVSCALLKNAGFDVTGVFIKVWQPDWIECTWREDRRDAMRVAAHLGVPFITLDLEKEYKQGVIDYMIAEYRAGRTPNPDVMCNREVKFGAFWRWAKEQDADYVATGHYSRINLFPSPTRSFGEQIARSASSPHEVSARSKIDANNFQLLAGSDHNKDQSYFLWTLNQDDLAHVIFPVGNLVKPEVRKLAKKFKLPNAEKKDSQGLCFIGKIDIKEFLAHYIKTEKGNVLNEQGEVIGSHPGSLLFTIGERHGFTITTKTNSDAPYYVTDKDVERNTITVSNKEFSHLLPGAERKVHIERVNWISGEIPPIGKSINASAGATKEFPFQARSRYRQELQNIRMVSANFSETVLEFEKPQDTLTSGQSLVIYDGEVCLGGGVII